MKQYRKHRLPDVKPIPSDRYQHRFFEILIDPTDMDDFDVTRGLGHHALKSAISNEFYDLQEKLIAAVKRIIDTRLTAHQAKVLHLVLQGFTQLEIAEQLQIHQTSVFKSLYGNMVYETDKETVSYGGSIKKLKRLCGEDTEIIEILIKMAEIRGMKPYDYY